MVAMVDVLTETTMPCQRFRKDVNDYTKGHGKESIPQRVRAEARPPVRSHLSPSVDQGAT